jgi:hypothetical protein
MKQLLTALSCKEENKPVQQATPDTVNVKNYIISINVTNLVTFFTIFV